MSLRDVPSAASLHVCGFMLLVTLSYFEPPSLVWDSPPILVVDAVIALEEGRR
jgi:hypothetical protein